MNCLVMYIWRLLDEGKGKTNSVLMKGKVESTYNIQQTMTVTSLERWKKKISGPFNVLYQFLVTINLNKFLKLHNCFFSEVQSSSLDPFFSAPTFEVYKKVQNYAFKKAK